MRRSAPLSMFIATAGPLLSLVVPAGLAAVRHEAVLAHDVWAPQVDDGSLAICSGDAWRERCKGETT
jgi:hypothetical protein